MPVRQHGWDLPTGRIGRYPPIPQVPTLATVLRAKGFATAGLYANSYLAEEIGFDRGFDSWHRTGDSGMAKAVRDEVGGWSDGRRHFLYVHIMGPHSPLDPSEVARERWKVDPAWLDDRGALSIGIAKRDQQPGAREAYRAAYHAVVEDTDLLVSEIVHALGSLTADTMLVVTSDHGELLGEHGTVGHGSWVWEPLTGVPLIAVGGPRLPRATSTTVIPDVITRGLGVPHAWPTSVEAPLPLVAQREGKLALSADGRTKAVWNGAEPVVFDLEADPLEMRPIPGRGPAMTPAREAWEARTPAGTASNTSVALHPDTVEALRAMGYLADPPATAAGE